MAKKPEKEPVQPPPEEEPKDKAKEVLEELRRRSSEIVIRQAFKTYGKAGQNVQVNDITQLLDDVVGLNGWDIDFAQLSDACVLCKLRVKVEGEFVSRCGVGVLNTVTSVLQTRWDDAIRDAVFNASRLFGIGRDNWRSTQPAAAATPVKEEPKKESPKESPKQEPKKAESKKESGLKMLADYMDEWRIKLAGVDTPEELNDSMPALKSVPAPFKGEVWKYVQKWAKEDAHQWAYDPDTKKFFDPNVGVEVGEVIPF